MIKREKYSSLLKPKRSTSLEMRVMVMMTLMRKIRAVPGGLILMRAPLLRRSKELERRKQK